MDYIKSWLSPAVDDRPHGAARERARAATSSSSSSSSSTLADSQGSQFLHSKAAKIQNNPYLRNADRSCCTGPGIVSFVHDLPPAAPAPKVVKEGFGDLETPAVSEKNLAEFKALQALQATYNQKLSAYAAAHKTLMDSTSRYVTSNNADQRKDFTMRVTHGPLISEIPVTKQGCYLLGDGNRLDKQTDLGENVTQSACVMRAADLGYSVAGLQGGTGHCYVGNNLEAAQSIGEAFTPQTSYAFSASMATTAGVPIPPGINQMQLFNNGQIGLYNSSVDYVKEPTKLLLFNTPIEGCDLTQGGNIIMQSATYGGNCDKQLDIIPRATLTSDLADDFCVNQYGGSTMNYLHAEMRKCQKGAQNQEFTYDPTTKAIKYGNGGKCLDVEGARSTAGTNIIQFDCHGKSNQQWTYGADKTLRPGNAPNMCLNVWGGSSQDGSELRLQQCQGQSNQKFTFRKPDGTAVAAPSPPVAPTPVLGNTSWLNLPTPSNAKLTQVAHNVFSDIKGQPNGVVCGIDGQNKALYCADLNIDNSNIKWIPMAGKYSAVSIAKNGNVILLGVNGQQFKVTNFKSVNQSTPLPGPQTFTQLDYDSTVGLYCGLDSNNGISCMREDDPKLTWVPLSDSSKTMQQIALAPATSRIYGLDSITGTLYYLDGVFGSSSKWQKVDGTGPAAAASGAAPAAASSYAFQHFSVDDKNLCGVNKPDGIVYCTDTSTIKGTTALKWTKMSSTPVLKSISLKSSLLYGLDAGSKLYTGKAYNLL